MASTGAPVTQTSRDQKQLTDLVGGMYALAHDCPEREAAIQLRRREHVAFLERGLEHMGPGYAVLDSSRPWLCYWILHSLALLGETITPDVRNRCIDFLKRCQDPGGGYGGGPGQLPHLATTYAAVCALATAGGAKALESIDRRKLLDFLLRMKAGNGGFHMHDDGEIDVRGSYCAMTVAHMLNLKDERLTAGVGAYIATCQTYEGGIGGEPGVEAHGGYTFCGLAAALLAHQSHLLNLPLLLSWLVFRQGAVEGGFQGRTNKLVDGCYSFWQGGTFLLLQRIMPQVLRQGGRTAVGKGGAGGESPGVREGAAVGEGEADTAGGSEERPVSAAGRGPGNESGRLGRGDSTDGVRWDTPQGSGDWVGREDAGGAASLDAGGTLLGENDGWVKGARVERNGASTRGHQVADDTHGPIWCKDSTSAGHASDRASGGVSAEPALGLGEPGPEGPWAGGAERQSASSSEYETDDDEWGAIRTATDLFPCEPLEDSDGCSCGEVGIEEETDSGTAEGTGDEMQGSLSSGAAEEGGVLWEPLLNARALQAYILLCCQQADGGLRDKPKKARDYYHTCYCLSGLSAAQWCRTQSAEELPRPRHVLGPYSNLLEPADPICNVHVERCTEAVAHFAGRPLS